MNGPSTGLALPKVLQDSDAKSWFKTFEVCAAANEWDNGKKLKCLPTLLRGRAWAIFDALPDTSTDTYEHLKEALLSGLSPDTEEDRQSAHESLSRRKLRENQESVDELARDLERLLDKRLLVSQRSIEVQSCATTFSMPCQKKLLFN